MLLLLLLPPPLLLLTKRRGDAGLLRMRVCGFWGLVAQCGAVQLQRSAAQETRRLGRRRVQKLS